MQTQLSDLMRAIEQLQRAQRVLLHDRIKHLCCRHIEAEAISYDDRRDLLTMHGIYTSDLGGNGNLQRLVDDVSELPVKT